MKFRLFFIPVFFFILTENSNFSEVFAQVPEKKLSIDVKDTDIKDVIRIISKGYDINILLDQDISGKVTMHLVDVPIMEGLRSIAASNGLEVVQDGAVFKIKKASEEQRSMIRYSNEKLTVDVQNVDVKDFLKELSSKTAVSIVPDAKVEGKVTGKLYEVSLDDGLRALMEGNGFKITRRRNIYQVLTKDESGGASSGPRYNPPGNSGGTKFQVDYNDGKISLDVSNGDLEDIIRSIAEQSDVEIITYGSLKSEINAKLNSVPLTEALALLLGGTRFTFVQKDNVLLIGDRNTATPSGQALSKSELIHLRHIKADNIPAILPKDIPSTNVRVIKEQNALLISGTSEDIVQAREFLKTIDIPTPQVRIDAVIVEFKDNLDKEFGIRSGRVPGFVDSSYMITPFPSRKPYYNGYQHFELGMSGKFIKELWHEIFPKNNWDIIKKSLPEDFWTILRFLETQDKAKVLAQPSILTLNGNKASIDVSETQYFKVTTGINENLTSRFQPIKFGIQLDIVPWIAQSGQITAEITPNVSNSEKTNNEGYPNVSTRSITTTVRLNDGETLVLGGLVKNQETTFNYKIPILGNIPIIGVLFKHSGKTRTKSNLVVFITPHVVTDNQHIDLEREIEKYDLHDKNFIERHIYKGVQKINKVLNGPSDSIITIDSKKVEEQDTTAILPIDSSSIVQVKAAQSKQNDPRAANVDKKDKEKKENPDNSGIERKQNE
jgi:type IV pilus assembly protein PilQ